jgi:exopolyphosphatase/guanosine-5'-triphosphate,3'-diphosphate pyrophosphatase
MAGVTHGTREPESDHVVGFLDIGTSSVRLMLVLMGPGHAHRVISLQREVVRLGDGEFGDSLLRPAAIERAVAVCRSFAELARQAGASQIVTAATSATREARNQPAFLARLRDEAGVDVHVVSGSEEARLIYLSVLGSVDLGERTSLCLDIGGGSTEVIVGDARRPLFLDSLPLGAVRLAGDPDLPDVSGRVSAADYKRLQRAVRLASVRAVSAVNARKIDVAYGTSGTIRSLAAVSARVLHGREPQRDQVLTLPDLRKTIKLLRAATLNERRRLPGLKPDRADVVIAGAAVLETLMTDLRLPSVTALSEGGLRKGLLMDYLSRSASASHVHELSVRERSLMRLVRVSGADEVHARHVARLALELFDSARKAGLHGLGAAERELLNGAALTHDVGSLISYADHHVHSAYLIGNADLLGFDQREIAVMASTALFHRKARPSARHGLNARLDAADRKTVRALSTSLRLAELLDRSHTGAVRHARLEAGSSRRELVLWLATEGPAQLELSGLEKRRGSMEKTLGRRLSIVTAPALGGPDFTDPRTAARLARAEDRRPCLA